MKYHSNKTRQRAIDLYRSNPKATTRQIAAIVDANKQTVADWIKAAGLTRGRNDTREVTIDRHELHRLYIEEKKSERDIATALEVSRRTVRRRLEYFKIPLRTPREANELYLKKQARKHKNQARKLRRRGLTYAEISRVMNVSMSTAFKYGRIKPKSQDGKSYKGIPVSAR